MQTFLLKITIVMLKIMIKITLTILDNILKIMKMLKIIVKLKIIMQKISLEIIRRMPEMRIGIGMIMVKMMLRKTIIVLIQW